MAGCFNAPCLNYQNIVDMQLKLEKTFAIEASTDTAWRFLCDIKQVAECMPGAQITEQISDTQYLCQENLRVGPINANFKGNIDVKLIDENEKKLHIVGKGNDVMGNSTTSMDLSVWIRPSSAGQCELFAISDIHISGQMANFGSRMMVPIADQIIKQFGDNFAKRVLAGKEETTVKPESTKVKRIDGLVLFWNILLDFVKTLLARFKK